MWCQSLKAIVLTITSLAVSSCALPNLAQPLPTHEVTDAARFSNDTHRNPIAINTDSGTNNQVSIYTKHEEPPYAVLLVQSLPSSYNITLPVSVSLRIQILAPEKTPFALMARNFTPYSSTQPIVSDPPSAGILGPQVGKLTEGFCLWSSSSEYANVTRLVRSLKCPVRQNSYMHLFTQSECRGKYVLSDSFGWNVTLFDEVVEEWSILFTCSDYEYAAGEREPAIEKMQELKFGDVEEEIAAIESPIAKLKLPEPHQISAVPQNATLASTRAFQPQIFQIPLSNCLSSTSDTHIFSSFVRIVTPPTCPPELPELWTLKYAKPGCLDLLRFSPTEPSYPLHKSLFENISRASPRVDGWSLGFVCHPTHFDGRVDPRDWKMETEMELILERKGTRDVALKVLRSGAGKRREEGLTQGVQLESQIKIEAAQKPLKDV
ncbi:hypothetical protein EAF00_002406 [Botryotinia globosa]|nr:hypothetical protein EAF00_002406 [Botryotinia globosa]